ncbi:MAG: hypothetical protein MR374_08585 [Clostridia bacterium]|nr:hypothetical protein [Clostridia bacterium]
MRERKGRLTLFGEVSAQTPNAAETAASAGKAASAEKDASAETAGKEPNAAEKDVQPEAAAAKHPAAAKDPAAAQEPAGDPERPSPKGTAGEKPGENWERGEEEARRLRREVENRLQESRALQREYPGFSLRREMQSPDFARLIAGGVSMRRAFETVHFSEILFGAMQRAAKESQIRALEEIRQRGMRPAENGLSPRGGTAVKKSAGEFTREERQSLIRRLERGEKVAL